MVPYYTYPELMKLLPGKVVMVRCGSISVVVTAASIRRLRCQSYATEFRFQAQVQDRTVFIYEICRFSPAPQPENNGII